MPQETTKLIEQIFDPNMDFEATALKVFRFQAGNNPVYREFLDLIKCDASCVCSIKEIPFLPIELFKSHKVLIGDSDPEIIFESSGTTGSIPSRHYVKDLSIYEKSIEKGFEQFFGSISDYQFFPLLPAYLERQGSSLIYMVQKFMEWSGQEPKFYLYEHEELIADLKKSNKKPFLIGVSFALLDLCETVNEPLGSALVMETGGMKGRRREMIREELHSSIKNGLGIENVMSEYGMTELLSQAYSKKAGIFNCPSWMSVVIKDPYDPERTESAGKTGLINVIDLANIYSCSFIATSDLGKQYSDGSFEVLGRVDNSDIRGCNLLVV